MAAGDLEFSYAPDLYIPPSPSLWASSATAAAAAKPLAWKVNGPAPSPQQQQAGTSTSFRRPDAPHASPAGAISNNSSRAAHSSKPFATAAAAPDRGAPNSAVLGAATAGYRSVVTKTPISPSGYAVQASSRPSAQQQQQQQVPGPSSIRLHGGPQLLHSSYAQPAAAPCYYHHSDSSSAHVQPPGAPASAAAAALAALGGSHTRTGSTPAAASSAGGYTQQYAARNYTPAQVPESSTGGSRGSMLLWNISKQPPPQGMAGQLSSSSVTGRRAATAGQQHAAAAAAEDYQGSQTSGSGGSSRPPSGDSGSPGLLKLKQLSTARLVRRLGTPPGASLADAHDSSSDGGRFGTRPAACAAAAGPGCTLHSPSAGRRAEPTQQHTSRQQEQRLQQEQHRVAPRQQPQQQANTAGVISRPAEHAAYRRSSSSSSSSSSSGGGCPSRHKEAPRGPAQVQQSSQSGAANSSSGSTGGQPQGFISRMLHGFDGGPHAAAAAPTMQLPPGAEYQEVNRQPCPSCGRRFAPPALQQHLRICDKVFGQKRKVFDVKKQRLQGTAAAAAASGPRGNSAGRSSNPRQQQQQQPRGESHDKRPTASAAQAKKSKWQLQSEQLRAAMRATRPQVAGSWGGPVPQVEEVEDTRVQCPHCGRRFAELVAERHIPKCSDIIAKPSRLKAAGGRAAYMRCNSRGR